MSACLRCRVIETDPDEGSWCEPCQDVQTARRYLREALDELRTGQLIMGIDHVQLALDELNRAEEPADADR